MKQNRKRKVLHSALRANRLSENGGRRRVIVGSLAVAFLIAFAIGAGVAYRRMRALWVEQCVITDTARQVEITTGPNIKAGFVLESFGLRPGANLALIDFGRKRRELLSRVPNIRTLTVTRHLPDRVSITVEEREPVARLALKGERDTGRVVDAEGVVFRRQTGTHILPTITERAATPAGKRLSARTLAALRLIETCRENRFAAAFSVLDVSTLPTDYLYVTLSNYTFLKIEWENMDAPIASTEAAMEGRLDNYLHCSRTNTTGPGVVWNATLPDRCFVDTKEPIQ